MKWLIKCPAPADSRGKQWGDYHFGRRLARWLDRLGQYVEMDYHGQWESGEKADVTVVLRGRHPCLGGFSGLKVLWIISHPETVSEEECSSYDLVFVASYRHSRRLASSLGVPVFPLLQCVDTEYFRPPEEEPDHPRSDVVFVGNTRGSRRDCVLWAVETGLPVKVWGRGWESWIDSRFVVADYVANEDLPLLYSRAKVVLNDHWPDMRRFGFINNRIFEALSCGVPVISDYLDELEDLFGSAVLSFRNRDEFSSAVERLLLAYPMVIRRVQEVVPLVHEQHSFETRARMLLDAVQRHLG